MSVTFNWYNGIRETGVTDSGYVTREHDGSIKFVCQVTGTDPRDEQVKAVMRRAFNEVSDIVATPTAPPE